MNKECLICERELFSSIGFGCKLCAMPLEFIKKGFCCEDCKHKYKEIKKEVLIKND